MNTKRYKPKEPCKPCDKWTKHGCLERRPRFPVIGKACRGWSREPGSDDSIGELRLIVAGGRNYRLNQIDRDYLDKLNPTEIVSGCAPGVDSDAIIYALDRGLCVERFPANWEKHGKAAGPIRNRQMAEYADAVALFPGGRGTASMRKEAERAVIKVHIFQGGW